MTEVEHARACVTAEAAEQVRQHGGQAYAGLSEDELRLRIADVERALLSSRTQTDFLVDQTVGLAKEEASMLAASVVSADYDLKLARQEYYGAQQDLVHTRIVSSKLTCCR